MKNKRNILAVCSIAAMGLLLYPATTYPATFDSGGSIIGIDFNEKHVYWSRLQIGAEDNNVVLEGTAIDVQLPRAALREHERWLDAVVKLAPEVDLADTRLDIGVYAARSATPQETITITPPGNMGVLSVDLRSRQITSALVHLELYEKGAKTASAMFIITAKPFQPLSLEQRIELVVDRPAGTEIPEAWPVMCGIPFPRGALWNASNLRLKTDGGIELPLQTEVTARWAREGSIQWLRCDTLIPPDERIFLEIGEVQTAPNQPIKITPLDKGRIELDTGTARYFIGTDISPIQEIYRGETLMADTRNTRGLYVIDQNGREARASAEGATMDIEADGPIAACIRIEGDYTTSDGEPVARHITRIEAFAGQPFAKITHTLIITRDTNEIWLREIGWELNTRTGKMPSAVFNIARDNPAEILSTTLKADESAHMFQTEHQRFVGGTNHFEVRASNELLAEGEECGNWALLHGTNGGLMVFCRETARQHPKEFELTKDRMTLRLFSNRAGEELDFRGAALAEKWNLEGKIGEQVSELNPSAIGWSKTHELMLTPLPVDATLNTAIQLASLRSTPIYASADPQWIYQTDAMGPLYPCDRENHADIEELIDVVFAQVERRGHATGHYGFMDYFAGPTYSGGSGFCSAGRYRFTYGLRNSIWLAYARSGRRDIRAFAEGSNRAFLDNYLSHWDAPGRTRGIWSANGGNPYNQLPFYWGAGGSSWDLSSSANLNQFLWLYHLTGYRRARDAVSEFGEGFKRDWTPGTRTWRPLMVFRMLTQCYGLEWDPQLRAQAEATFDSFIDPESEILLTKNRPYDSSSYKTREDVRALIDGWHAFGTPKFREVATAVAHFWWRHEIGTQPIGRMRALPHVSALLYEQTGSPALLAGLEAALLRAGKYDGPIGTSSLCSIFESLPYALGVLGRADRQPTPWIDWRDYGYESSVLAKKTTEGIIDFTVQRAGGAPGAQFQLTDVGEKHSYGRDLDSVHQHSRGAGSARVPKDAPAGVYRIQPLASGDQFVVISQDAPMVLYAPKYWHLPEIAPTRRVYFKLSEQSEAPAIQFEGKALLFDPEGELFGDPSGQKGWVELPPDRPGLWSFEPLENRLVRVLNLPPFFAFGDPRHYFEPDIDWQDDEPREPAPSPPDPDTVYVTGVITGEDQQALYLHGNRQFQLETGPPHNSGDGGQFLPGNDGTIEFFFKPDWHTFDLNDGARTMIRVETDASPFSLVYRVDPEGTKVNLGPCDPSHSLYGSMHLDNGAHLRNWLTQQLIESNEWIHIAWSWGTETIPGPRRNQKFQLMTMHIYVNGRGRRQVIFRSAVGALPAGIPRKLLIGPLGGAIDQLRISDIQRYTGNFDPPSRKQPMPADEHTRALFEFNGTLEGESPGADTSPVGTIN